MKIRLVEVVLFDSVRHDEAYSHFLRLWDRAKNVYDKAYVKPLRNILHGSMDLVQLYSRIFQLPLQSSYNINCTEQSGIKDKTCLNTIMYVCVYIYVCQYQNKPAYLNFKMFYILSRISLKCFLWFSRRGMIRLKEVLTG